MCIPLVRDGMSGNANDLLYHLQRIEGIRQQLLDGTYPGAIYTNFCNGYGYGSPLFYPDYLLIVPALLSFLGLSPLAGFKLFCIMASFGVTFSSFFSYRYLTKGDLSALCATFLLCLSPFYIGDLLGRIGISEYLAFIFMPIMLVGLYNLLEEKFEKPWLLGIGFAGLLLTHTIMFFIGVILAVILSCLRLPVFLKEPRRAGKLVVTALVTMCCTCFYWLPMLEQFLQLDLVANYPWTTVGENMQSMDDWFGYIIPVENNQGAIGLPILLFSLIHIVHRPKDSKLADRSLLIGLLIFLATTSIVPWQRLSGTILNMIQFTWRLYPYALFFTALGLGITAADLFTGRYARDLTIIIVGAVCLSYGVLCLRAYKINPDTLQITREYLQQEEKTFSMGRNEWLIAGMSFENCNSPLTVVTAENIEIPLSWRRGNSMAFQTGEEASSAYRLPLLYYMGYSAYIEGENGLREDLSLTVGENTQVKIENPSLRTGTVYVSYAGTQIWIVSHYFSAAAIVGVSLSAIGKLRRKRKAQR